jgi:hypothetical protein
LLFSSFAPLNASDLILGLRPRELLSKAVSPPAGMHDLGHRIESRGMLTPLLPTPALGECGSMPRSTSARATRRSLASRLGLSLACHSSPFPDRHNRVNVPGRFFDRPAGIPSGPFGPELPTPAAVRLSGEDHRPEPVAGFPSSSPNVSTRPRSPSGLLPPSGSTRDGFLRPKAHRCVTPDFPSLPAGAVV